MEKVEVKLYIGVIRNTTIGGWLKLPVAPNKLDEEIEKLVGRNEFLTCDVENKYPDVLYIGEYSSIEEINNYLNHLNGLDDETRMLEMAIYSYSDGDLGFVKRALKNLDSIDFYGNVESDEDEVLGKILVNNGYIGCVTDELKEWIDYEKVGRNGYCDGFRYIKSLKAVIRQKQGFFR